MLLRTLCLDFQHKGQAGSNMFDWWGGSGLLLSQVSVAMMHCGISGRVCRGVTAKIDFSQEKKAAVFSRRSSFTNSVAPEQNNKWLRRLSGVSSAEEKILSLHLIPWTLEEDGVLGCGGGGAGSRKPALLMTTLPLTLYRHTHAVVVGLGLAFAVMAFRLLLRGRCEAESELPRKPPHMAWPVVMSAVWAKPRADLHRICSFL